MENSKPFKEGNIVAMCSYISKHCELYINNATSLSTETVKDFHNYFPQLLVDIFGSPTKRGWMQTETKPEQDTAIKNLLSVQGQFFKALVKLANYPEYSLDLITDSLPADVKKVLNSGSIHLLPKVYENCSYLVTSSNNSIDIRTAATKQSTLLPTSLGGDRKIKFNILQFYLYYFISVPTWPPVVPPPVTNTTRTNGLYPNTLTPKLTPTYKPLNATTQQPVPRQLPGVPRYLSKSVYSFVLEGYLNQLCINPSIQIPISDTFFTDTIVELWIRTTWIATNQSLDYDFMKHLIQFVQYVTRQDLRQCLQGDKSPKSKIYAKVHEELYMLISRLAINWKRHDDYLSVVNLWCVWASPWTLGTTPKTKIEQEYSPIQTGWPLFILDNILYYIFIVDIFFQRTSTFLYKESTKSITSPGMQVPIENESKSGQMRILYRIANVFHASGLVDFLGLVEHGLLQVQVGTATLSIDPFKQLSKLCYGTETMDYKVHEKITKAHTLLIALDGVNGVWKPKGLYAKDITPRSDVLLKSLVAINNAIAIQDNQKWNNNDQTKSSNRRDSLKSAYDNLYSTFKIVGTGHLATNTPKPINGKLEPLKKSAKTDWIRPSIVGNNGFLTTEERNAIKQGRAVCSYDNIPALGDRAINFVRSYEVPVLVRWTVRTDKKLNTLYNRYLPTQKRPNFLPKTITIHYCQAMF
ncbi:hypothetical protein INT48_000150 [Thamnidium elegans]|uniref:Uncharacterized protein n=1 Tax=Thamnidium elegans TaxID=101142 RepID=A0A8H7SYB5_9FUNG|nr:hypothetical protein INT48_000150 [Thamnidium elegans]